MSQVQERQIYEEYANQLLARVENDYTALKPELKQIAERYPESDDEFSFAEEFELWIENVCGYARQIQSTGRVRQFETAIAHLHQLQLLANPTLVKFYGGSNGGQYPNLQAYMRCLDYLRLLTLEYLQMQRLVHPVSA